MRATLTRLRGAGLRGLIGVALLLVGIGAAIVASSFDGTPRPTVLGGDLPVNAGAGYQGDISAHNSPTVARNPVRPAELAVANRIDSPRFSCALHVSSDGGGRWAQIPIPIPKGEEPKCYAPDVTFAADGTMYMSFVTLRGTGNTPHAVWLVNSRDGGRTLSKPAKVLDPFSFQVRLSADPVSPRRLYLTWVQSSDAGVALYRFAQPGNPVQFKRSDDGGRTWTPPVRVNDPSHGRAVAPSHAVGPKGELYVLYLDLGEDRLDYEGGHQGMGGPPYPGPFKLVLGRSLDQGATWGESVVDERIVPTERFLVFLPPFPSLAVDRRSGRVYAGFQDRRLGDPDAWVWSLPPGAARWEGPTRVNDTSEGDGTAQYLPKLAVAPNGRLDVVYYDRRFDPKDVLNDVSLQSSFDAGQSFTAAARLSSRSFDSKVGFGSERNMPELGSRIGLLSDDSRAFAVWSDTRAGNQISLKQDLTRAVVGFSEPSRLAAPFKYLLLFGGIALALVGLFLVVSALRRSRSSSGAH